MSIQLDQAPLGIPDVKWQSRYHGTHTWRDENGEPGVRHIQMEYRALEFIGGIWSQNW